MFNYEDILAMMQNGTSAENIAKEFTDSLNQAIKVQEEEKQKVAAKAAVTADAQKVADAFNEFTAKHYADVASGAEITAEDIITIYDLVSNININFSKLKNGVSATCHFGKSKLDDVDEIIENFFDKYGLR